MQRIHVRTSQKCPRCKGKFKDVGVKLGRPRGAGKSKLDEYKEEIVALLRNGSTKAFVSDRYGTSQVNLYTWIKKNRLDVTCQKACV